MKKILLTLTLALTAVVLMEAQTYRDYNPNDYRRYNYRNGNVGAYNDYTTYSGYRYLPRHTRNRLAKLEYKLADEKRCALRDGYISRREARRIGRIQNEIDALLFDYRRNSYERNRGRFRCR